MTRVRECSGHSAEAKLDLKTGEVAFADAVAKATGRKVGHQSNLRKPLAVRSAVGAIDD